MPPQKRQTLCVAVDTGGTFTDCVWLEDGRLRILKVFSTPADPSHAIARALQQIGAAHELLLLHGTTVGTNALLQRRGARVAFVTTEGFEDSIEIGRQARPKLYDLFFDRILPLVLPELRFGVRERVSADGKALQSPDSTELAELRRRVQQLQPESIAVSLLFSFANPLHERQVGKALRPLQLPVSLSHIILPEFREYERGATVVVNAYLQPVMQAYLEGLERRARQAARQSRVFVMQSSGGITALETAASEPVRTVLSGPAGGVIGAAAMAARSGFARIIGFDMGGTSTDVALVEGAPTTTNEGEVAGLPVRVPMLNIHTVGAGGGSIARFDDAGALRVGPESAGADPGPICYGRAEQPTVTDANLVLGRLPARNFLGGDFVLDEARARSVMQQWLKRQTVRMSLEQFAEGIIRVVNANMEKAIRVVSVQKGFDPRDFALVAFGGAGGLHACELAQALGIPRVIVPVYPGALSAFGILASDVVRDYSRTVLWAADRDVRTRMQAEFATMERQAVAGLRAQGWTGKPKMQRTADVRYRGQGFELTVPADARMLAAFHAAHRRRYGYSRENAPVEVVTLRLRASLPGLLPPKLKITTALRAARPATHARLIHGGKDYTASAHDRETLKPGKTLRGPAVVAEYSATTFVPPGCTFTVDRAANLVIAVPSR